MNSTTIDLIIRIKNGYMSQRASISAPFSRANESILKILKEEELIKNYQIIKDGAKKTMDIDLLYPDKIAALTGVRILSKPGRRMYRTVGELKPVVSGMGLAIISTPKGLMTNKKAKKNNVGGEILFELW